jgi:branched-chain amino acid transport system permease protein
MEFSNLFVQFLHGIVYAMLLFMVSSGLTLVFGMLGVLNFAHGSLYMVGAYIGLSTILWTKSFWASLIVAPLLVALLGIFLETFFLKKTYARGHVSQLMLTFGLAYILDELTKIIWGTESYSVEVPLLLKKSVMIMGNAFPLYRIAIIFFGLLLALAIWLLLKKTRLGMIIRAAVFSTDLVKFLGFNQPWLFRGVFAFGAALAALGGVIASPLVTNYPGMGADIIIDAFIVIIVGGLGSFGGALIGSLLIGQVTSFGILFLPRFALVFCYILMAIVLIIRPTGILGEEE